LGDYIQMQITERKRAELERKAEGLSNRVIAQIVGGGETTVRRHLAEERDAPNGALGVESIDGNATTETESAPNGARNEASFDPETGELLEDGGAPRARAR
jgi:hypothetical protein